MSRIILVVAAVMAASATTGVFAQTRAGGAGSAVASGGRSGNPPYSRSPGTSGTITASTPNRDGNLGGPSTGGGAGSP